MPISIIAKKNWFGLLLIPAVLWLALLPLWQGVPAPKLTVTDIQGQSLTIPRSGRPMLVTFWASDCPSCIREIPHLTELYQRFHDKGFELIAVAMAYDPPSRVVALSRQKHLPYPIVLDTGGQIAQAFGKVRLTPSTFLLAPNGKIDRQILGPFDFADLTAKIQHLLMKTSVD